MDSVLKQLDFLSFCNSVLMYKVLLNLNKDAELGLRAEAGQDPSNYYNPAKNQCFYEGKSTGREMPC